VNYFAEAIKSGVNEYYEILNKSLDSLSENEIIWRPNAHSNNIIFLIWHMALVEDNLVNKVLLGQERIWISKNYYEKYPKLKNEIGFGFTQKQIDEFPIIEIDFLSKYSSDVKNRTINLLDEITEKDLSLKYSFFKREVSGYFILGRLITELNQHLGQVSYVRGMMRGLNK
tara:strand:- start:838 stop:1350 length:513 start_codon:yes stop_codon:yes gene_type:complete